MRDSMVVIHFGGVLADAGGLRDIGEREVAENAQGEHCALAEGQSCHQPFQERAPARATGTPVGGCGIGRAAMARVHAGLVHARFTDLVE